METARILFMMINSADTSVQTTSRALVVFFCLILLTFTFLDSYRYRSSTFSVERRV
jgi:hypothetical protein